MTNSMPQDIHGQREPPCQRLSPSNMTARTLTSEAKYLTGRDDVKVHCQRGGATMVFAGAEAGHVMWEENDIKGTGSEIWLTFETCSQIRKWLNTGKDKTTLKDAQALHVFVHEAAHTAGEKNEARTECTALISDAKAFAHMGATNEVATQLVKEYATAIYPRMPDAYRTDCSKEEKLIVMPPPKTVS